MIKNLRQKLVRGAKVLLTAGTIAGIALGTLTSTPVHADTTDNFIMVQIGLGQGFARINPDGTGYHPYVSKHGVYTGGWSLDGDKFAYRYHDGNVFNVGVYDVTNDQDLGTVVANANYEGWTPDGRVIYKDNASGAFAATMPGSTAKQYYSYGTPAYSTQHTYSPDGSKLAYVSIDGATQPFIAVRDANGGNLTNIAPAISTQRLAWSASGKLVFDSITPTTSGNQRYEVHVANADGTGLTNVSADLPREAHNASLSPNGNTVAYSLWDEASGLVVFTRTIPNGTPHKLSNDYLLDPQWRPGSPTEDQPPQVSAGADFEARTNMNHQLHGSVTDDGQSGALHTSWTIVSGPGAVHFTDSSNPSTTVSFATPGTYTLRLSASDGEHTREDTVVVKAYKEYRAELKAWIPQQQVVDPMAPVSFQLPSGLVSSLDNSQGVRSCIQQVASNDPIAPITINTVFEGDNHTSYGTSNNPTTPDYRVRSWATFRWDGNEISHFEQGGNFGQTTRIITASRNGQSVTCKQQATALTTELVPGTLAGNKKSFTLTVKGQNPLTPNEANSDNFGNIVNTYCLLQSAPAGYITTQLCHAVLDNLPLTPAIDGTATGSLNAQGELSFNYNTDFFPNYGLAVTENGHPTGDVVVNQTNCVNTTGIQGAANLFARLNTQLALPGNTGTATANTGDTVCNPNVRPVLTAASYAIILPIIPFEPLLFPPVTYLP